MSRTQQSWMLGPWTGGLNVNPLLSRVLPNQYRIGRNLTLEEDGGVSPRPGLRGIIASGSRISDGGGVGAFTDIWHWAENGQLLLFTSGATPGGRQLYTGTNPYGSVSLTARGAPGATSVENESFAGFRNASAPCAFFTNNGTLMSWDGTTLVSSYAGVPTVFGVICVHNNRLWGAVGPERGTPGQADTLYASSLGNGTTLGVIASGGAQIPMRAGGAFRITALASVGASLMVFHERSISRVVGYGLDDIQVQPNGVSETLGAIAPNAVCAGPNGTAFAFSREGLAIVTEGGARLVARPDMPDPTAEVMRREGGGTLFFLSRNVRVVYDPTDQMVYVTMPALGATPAAIYGYDVRRDVWTSEWPIPLGNIGGSGYSSVYTIRCDAQGPQASSQVRVVLLSKISGTIDVFAFDRSILRDRWQSGGGAGSPFAMQLNTARVNPGASSRILALRWASAEYQRLPSLDVGLSLRVGPDEDIVQTLTSPGPAGTLAYSTARTLRYPATVRAPWVEVEWSLTVDGNPVNPIIRGLNEPLLASLRLDGFLQPARGREWFA